jgi:ribonuclease HI
MRSQISATRREQEKMPYYAVHKGRGGPNIYSTWPECKKAVDGLVGAVYKKFESMDDANKFMKQGFEAMGGSKPKGLIRHEKYETDNKDEIDAVLNAPDAHRNIIAYTDGSCIRQDGKVYCGYGIVIPDLNIKLSERLNDTKLTNNRAEMRAILHAIEIVTDKMVTSDTTADSPKGSCEMKATKRICIFTDSQYCKYIFQGTGERYERDGFMKRAEGGGMEEVPNKDMIKTALSYIRAFDIAILKVRAHTGAADVHSSYNDMADQLANKGAFKVAPSETKSKATLPRPATLIEALKATDDDEDGLPAPLPLPFPKKDTAKKTVASSGEDYDNTYRYNDKKDWREEEKKKFANKTKLSDLMSVFTDDGPDEEATPIKQPAAAKKSAPVSSSTAATKPKKFTSVPLSKFLDFDGSNKSTTFTTASSKASSAKSISSFFTDDD